MNTNEIRFYLHNYDRLKSEIKNLQEALGQYRKMNVSGIKAQEITGMPICHFNISKTELMAMTRLDYIKDLEDETDSKLRLVRAINSVYFYLREPHRSIIEMRYFIVPTGRRKANWAEIAREVNLTEVNCKKIDKRIVLKIQLNYIQNVTCVRKTHVI
jgi:DNA-directed RNA polymerase specialized sigma subunit